MQHSDACSVTTELHLFRANSRCHVLTPVMAYRDLSSRIHFRNAAESEQTRTDANDPHQTSWVPVVAQRREVLLFTLRYVLHVCHREEDRAQEREHADEEPKSWSDVRTKR